MIIEFTARGTTISPKWTNMAETELARIDSMLGGAISAHVFFQQEKYRQIAEVTLQISSETIVASCEDSAMPAALHDVLHKIEQQAIKHKERRMTVERHAKPASSEPLIEVPDIRM